MSLNPFSQFYDDEGRAPHELLSEAERDKSLAREHAEFAQQPDEHFQNRLLASRESAVSRARCRTHDEGGWGEPSAPAPEGCVGCKRAANKTARQIDSDPSHTVEHLRTGHAKLADMYTTAAQTLHQRAAVKRSGPQRGPVD